MKLKLKSTIPGNKTQAKMRQLSNYQLKTICNSYRRPFSNKNKGKFIETLLLVPLVSQSITEVEKVLKYSFLQPLPQEDHSAHKLGSLNEERVCHVLYSIAEKLGWELIGAFGCGLICNKTREYLATSLNG